MSNPMNRRQAFSGVAALVGGVPMVGGALVDALGNRMPAGLEEPMLIEQAAELPAPLTRLAFDDLHQLLVCGANDTPRFRCHARLSSILLHPRYHAFERSPHQPIDPAGVRDSYERLQVDFTILRSRGDGPQLTRE